MILLDENIVDDECERLRGWGIPFKQIGGEAGRKGMDDRAEIVPLLHRLSQPTFFTRDADFYDQALCHSGYCLVLLSVPKDRAAEYIRRFLRHPELNTRAKRMGYVVRLNATGIFCRERQSEQEWMIAWSRERRR